MAKTYPNDLTNLPIIRSDDYHRYSRLGGWIEHVVYPLNLVNMIKSINHSSVILPIDCGYWIAGG